MSIVAHYIKERTKDAQFIIISLRNNMFELADRLVRPLASSNPVRSHVCRSHRCYPLSTCDSRPRARAAMAMDPAMVSVRG